MLGRHFKPQNLYLALFYLAILGVAIAIKWSYHTFDAVNDFRDTISYVHAADLPLTSPRFWAGERPFTLPLFYKVIGVGAGNYLEPAQMNRVSLVQSIFSLVAWAVLGITLAVRSRHRWLGAVIFGMVLAFSLTYEISRWDMLLLSESVSISLFALMLAGWIWLLGLPASWNRSPRGYLALAGTILVTILFSFTRDPNPYFVVLCAGVFVVASLLKRSGMPRTPALIYFSASILILLAQYASSSLGNRWQIFIYDTLAVHLGDDQKFTEYFQHAGLPMIEELITKHEEGMAKFQQAVYYDLAYAPVRQWVDESGKAAYMGYLLTNPERMLSRPILAARQMLDGTANEVLTQTHRDLYRLPLRLREMLPGWLRAFTRLFFSPMPLWAYGIVYLGLAGLVAWALARGWNLVPWLLIAVLLVTLYPLMVLIWFGDPLEIGRHALPLAINLRLAGWLSVAFVLDHWLDLRTNKVSKPA